MALWEQEKLDADVAKIPKSERRWAIHGLFISYTAPIILLFIVEAISWALIKPTMEVHLTPVDTEAGHYKNLFAPALERANFTMSHPVPLTPELLGTPLEWRIHQSDYASCYSMRCYDGGCSPHCDSPTPFDNAFDSFPRSVIYDSVKSLFKGEYSIPLESPEDIVSIIPDAATLIEKAMNIDGIEWCQTFVQWQVLLNLAHLVLHCVAWFFTAVLLQQYFWVWLTSGLYLAHLIAFAVCMCLFSSHEGPHITLLRSIFKENRAKWGLDVHFHYTKGSVAAISMLTIFVVCGLVSMFAFMRLDHKGYFSQQMASALVVLEKRDRKAAEEVKVEEKASV